MKRFLLLFFVAPFFTFGQVTITNPDFADGGDITYMSTATDPTIDFATTGANQTWDFSTLTSTGQTVRDYQQVSAASVLVQFVFGSFAASDYHATNFLPSNALPLAQISNFLPVTITDVNQYSKNSADAITSVGLSVVVNGTEIPFKSDTIETRYKFPLNFGDAYSSVGYSRLDMNPVYNAIWMQNRHTNSVVDGWGSITTSFGTFDVLRVDHFIQEVDSLYFDAFGNPVAVELPIPDSHQYEWIAVGQKEPILRITTTLFGGTETVTNIEFKDNNLSAGLTEASNAISIYPNPTATNIQLKGINSETNYTIYSMDGKLVLSGVVSQSANTIDVSSLENGKYTILMQNEGTSLINSFVKN